MKIKYWAYYLENLAKKINGRGLMNPSSNGEFKFLEFLVNNSNDEIVFFDGGGNIGEHTSKFLELSKNKKRGGRVYTFEPFKDAAKKLTENLSSKKFFNNKDYFLNEVALSDKEGEQVFYYDNNESFSGQNSLINHYMLNDSIDVKTTTIDNFCILNNINQIDFLKLDIEGYELKALLGAKNLLSDNKIKYIQLEYNQTWIEANASIEKVFNLCQEYNFNLFILSNKGLLSIPSYHFNLDDFFYCNLLLVHKNSSVPFKIIRKALPFI